MADTFFSEEETKSYLDEIFKVIYPGSSLESVIDWLRRTPNATTLRINLNRSTREEFISRLSTVLTSDRCQIVPHQILPDVVQVLSDPEEKVAVATSDDKIVIVGSQCGASILRGADVYVPGVQAVPAYFHKGDAVAIYADHNNQVLKGSKTEFCLKNKDSFLESMIFVGRGVANMSREDLFKIPRSQAEIDNNSPEIQSVAPIQKLGMAIKVTDSVAKCPRLSDQDCLDFQDAFLMQNLPSIVCGHVVDPHPGEKILDMCAAPGGKTSHLASILSRRCGPGNTCMKIIACDRSQNKINQINETCSRLKVSNFVDAFTQDGTKIEHCGHFDKNSFDKILVDAPCSALGQRPQFGQSKKVKELKSFANLQKKLFSKAIDLLKPGGFLIYSTCTFTIDENEGLVVWALNKFPELRLVEASPILGHPGVQVCGLTLDQAKMVQRFGHPEADGPLEDSIGFFIAKFRYCD